MSNISCPTCGAVYETIEYASEFECPNCGFSTAKPFVEVTWRTKIELTLIAFFAILILATSLSALVH
jgi:hypothetical protein